MDFKLSNKTALVSGSTAGIGLAIARSLAQEGATVIVNGRTVARVATAIDTLLAELPTAKLVGLAVDLSTAEGVQTCVSKHPEIDILVNNLGIFEPKPFLEIPDADWQRFFEVNVLSGVRLSRAYLPGMLARNWGRLIFISSESGVNIPAEMIHYGMTKTAQLAVARGLAETTAGTGVTVNSVLPGPTRSEGVEEFLQSMTLHQGISLETLEKQFFETVRPSSLLKRFATVEEVANLVTYVASELSSATNGAALRVDGGCVRSVI
ncbi:MAG: SDR family oxidoreductase [Acidobacteria bacterium]|nr:SDR family oxidoreductase [Acidobacteriota bacterium]